MVTPDVVMVMADVAVAAVVIFAKDVMEVVIAVVLLSVVRSSGDLAENIQKKYLRHTAKNNDYHSYLFITIIISTICTAVVKKKNSNNSILSKLGKQSTS